MAYFSIAVPIGVILSVVGLWLSGRWDTMPAVFGMLAGAIGTGLGLGAICSAVFIFNVPAPGDSPFKTRPGGNFIDGIKQMGTIFLLVIACAPELILGIISIVTRDAALGWVTAGVGLVIGVGVLIAGNHFGAKIFERNSSTLLSRLVAQR